MKKLMFLMAVMVLGIGFYPIPADVSAANDGPRGFVALTFDDGPSALTEELLGILREKGVNATFFVMGSRIEAFSGVICQALIDGNEIGNHTWSHPYLSKSSAEQITKEISKTNAEIYRVTGWTPKLMRTPYGDGAGSAKVQKAVGMTNILWSIDPKDRDVLDKDKVVKATLKNVKDGDIILLHDLYRSTIDAVPEIIDGLREQGFEIVTVSNLASIKGFDLTKVKSVSKIK